MKYEESTNITRRDFIKLAALDGRIGSTKWRDQLSNFRIFPRLKGWAGLQNGTLEIKSSPSPDSETVGVLYEDGVLPWLGEVFGKQPMYVFYNQKWVETPEGFVYGPYFQPVRNLPNQPSKNFHFSLGPGMWVEVTVHTWM